MFVLDSLSVRTALGYLDGILSPCDRAQVKPFIPAVVVWTLSVAW